ncbi:hypothetical protein HMI54_012215 [Coelomomyces lativittatus]|nr:hypothetical protein HMI56_004704 [Coelomomyces lativittatus]KAJ1498974.1 hypothetical protein HMI54_012215 [Coelomomyces lativittatus]
MGTNTHVSGVPSQSLSPVATGWPLPSASSISTHRYESVCQNLIQTFLSYTLPSSSSSTSSTHSDAHWQLIVDRGSDVQIWRHCQNEHRYKIMGIVDAPLITTFDFLNDIEARPTWYGFVLNILLYFYIYVYLVGVLFGKRIN